MRLCVCVCLKERERGRQAVRQTDRGDSESDRKEGREREKGRLTDVFLLPVF